MLTLAINCGLYNQTWQDIKSWSELTATTLTPWEASAIMNMSRAYTMAISEYDCKNSPAPWITEEVNRNEVAKSVRSALRGHRGNRRN